MAQQKAAVVRAFIRADACHRMVVERYSLHLHALRFIEVKVAPDLFYNMLHSGKGNLFHICGSLELFERNNNFILIIGNAPGLHQGGDIQAKVFDGLIKTGL